MFGTTGQVAEQTADLKYNANGPSYSFEEIKQMRTDLVIGAVKNGVTSVMALVAPQVVVGTQAYDLAYVYHNGTAEEFQVAAGQAIGGLAVIHGLGVLERVAVKGLTPRMPLLEEPSATAAPAEPPRHVRAGVAAAEDQRAVAGDSVRRFRRGHSGHGSSFPSRRPEDIGALP